MAVAQMDLCPDIVDWIAGMVLASPYSLSEQAACSFNKHAYKQAGPARLTQIYA